MLVSRREELLDTPALQHLLRIAQERQWTAFKPAPANAESAGLLSPPFHRLAHECRSSALEAVETRETLQSLFAEINNHPAKYRRIPYSALLSSSPSGSISYLQGGNIGAAFQALNSLSDSGFGREETLARAMARMEERAELSTLQQTALDLVRSQRGRYSTASQQRFARSMVNGDLVLQFVANSWGYTPRQFETELTDRPLVKPFKSHTAAVTNCVESRCCQAARAHRPFYPEESNKDGVRRRKGVLRGASAIKQLPAYLVPSATAGSCNFLARDYAGSMVSAHEYEALAAATRVTRSELEASLSIG